MHKKVTATLGTAMLALMLLWAAPADAFTIVNPDSNSLKFFWHGEKYAKLNEEEEPAEEPQEPTPDDPPTPEPPTDELASYSNAKYTIKSGDTLWGISRKLGVSVTQLKATNSLNSNIIYPGEVLYYATQNGNQSSSGSTTGTTNQKVFTQADVDLMAKAVYAESRGEPYTGQVAVAAVILNRVKSSSFPNSVYGVIYQPWAFSSTLDGQINLTPNATSYEAVYDAINGYDPSYGALFFYNPATSSSAWIFSRTTTVKIGNHIFAK